MKAVVFGYHNVGVRCLEVLLAQRIEVALVVTHEDNPSESIWFESLADLAALHDIPVIKPEDPNVPDVVERIAAFRPDFIFSFYYRQMLKKNLLDIPRLGAYNMHGSLLPKYRGRVPVNWAIIQGETETGATLHKMTEKPDNGDIVDQTAVPILPNDTAFDVFSKVTCAAEFTLMRALPKLVSGTAVFTKQDLSKGGYFGGRKPEDGRINWHDSAPIIHNLVRAVAPPYPGAYSDIRGVKLKLIKTLVENRPSRFDAPTLYCEKGRCYAECGQGVLRLVSFELDGEKSDASILAETFGSDIISLY
jgi:methionyl-tRNA formyltransferase